MLLVALLPVCLLAQVKVTFKTGKLPVTKGANLFLAGDFNNWTPADKSWQLVADASGGYSLVKEFNTGSINLKVTKGSWETAECDADGKPVGNHTYQINRDTTIVLDIVAWQDNFKAAEKKHTASANVQLMAPKFNIPQLGRQRRIWIYLPADYKTSRKRYPVIYMHDGQNLFDEYVSGYGEWGVDEALDSLPAKKQCIIVGIDNGGGQRISEYDPYDSKYGGKGRGDDYVDFLAKTLKPYVDSAYRTQKAAKYTTVAGSSMGGLISMYAVLKYPDVFGNAGIFSPAFWIAPEIFTYADKNLNKKSRFYFECGDAESALMTTDMQKMADLARSKGIDIKNAPTLIIKGAKHNERQWRSAFPAFYEWLGGR
ncbi:alpha/beta hydrolase-fold protein [Mucilaginibacter gynuensis]|uniref:Alpha/beta hydrolase-fold protein n=2 Tax=Mucilaginibacter gynuensis TaxID=1302236 RepID=A0ABP8HLW8_9SPHI